MSAFVLASASESRKTMLKAAGLDFEAHAASIDEDAVRLALLAEGADARLLAEALAEMKALRLCARHQGKFVLGADQILECEGEIVVKAESRETARATLRRLRGRPHRLVSAAVFAKDGAPVWRAVEEAHLLMRNFSDAFLENYLDEEGDGILGSVGCYKIEGRGAQLLESVSGDQFVVRGLPLLGVLDALRGFQILDS